MQSSASLISPTVIPISGPLGLADISIEVAGDSDIAAASVRFSCWDGKTIDVPMAMTAAAPGKPATATARIMAGPALTEPPLTGQFEYRIVLTNKRGGRAEGPIQSGSAAPPPGHTTPDWAKGAVWYQVFVERFRNGNPTNDPRSPEVFPASWNSDWNTVTTEELELARARAAAMPVAQSLPARRRGGQLNTVLPGRRYGGDLEGLVEKLDELRDLGVTALYLNPIFHAQSHHKYDATDYRHIDPNFAGIGRTEAEAAAVARETDDPATWTITAADKYFFETFIPEVRKRGMRIVLDGVWNHVGIQHWAFQDVVARGIESPYKDWFQCTFATAKDFPDWASHPLDVRPGRLVGWTSWGGEGHNGGLVQFARDNKTGRLFPAVEQHVFDSTARWTRAIDGWRLDVVPDLPKPFWRAWSDHVRSINADAALFAEVWFDAGEYFEPTDAKEHGKIFDGQMNYPFAMPAIRWLAGEHAMSSTKLIAQLERVFAHAPQHDLVQMNLFGSHDTERLASMLANPGRDYDQQGSPASNPRYNDRRPSEDVYKRCILAAALQTAMPGAPMVYYGDEYGMYGADDPHCRKPLPWPDRGPYPPGEQIEAGLRERTRDWLRLRTDPMIGEVLRLGSLAWLPTGNPDLLAIERRLNNQRVVVVLNRSNSPIDAVSALINALTNLIPNNTAPNGEIPPVGARVWRSRR